MTGDSDSTEQREEASDRVYLGIPGVYVDKGAHIAHFFTGEEERLAILVPWLRAGLEAGDLCVLITEPSATPNIMDHLRESGADVGAALDSERLMDAEDAAQEAFVSAFRAYPSFKSNSKVSTWLYRIVVNTCLMKIRKEKRQARCLTDTGYDDAIATDWTGDLPAVAMNVELCEVLETGLVHLSPELRAAVVLRDIQGFSNEEAAEVLATTVSAFKSRVHRGRVLLRKHLEEYVATRS